MALPTIPLSSLAVATTNVIPSLTPVTNPLSSTVAIFVSPIDQVTLELLAFVGKILV